LSFSFDKKISIVLVVI